MKSTEEKENTMTLRREKSGAKKKEGKR